MRLELQHVKVGLFLRHDGTKIPCKWSSPCELCPFFSIPIFLPSISPLTHFITSRSDYAQNNITSRCFGYFKESNSFCVDKPILLFLFLWFLYFSDLMFLYFLVCSSNLFPTTLQNYKTIQPNEPINQNNPTQPHKQTRTKSPRK